MASPAQYRRSLPSPALLPPAAHLRRELAAAAMHPTAQRVADRRGALRRRTRASLSNARTALSLRYAARRQRLGGSLLSVKNFPSADILILIGFDTRCELTHCPQFSQRLQ